MVEASELLQKAWEKREGPAAFATVGTDGKPNAIYVGEIRYQPDVGFVVADNYFDKTRRNIKNGSAGAILFITDEGKSYQVKGPLDYHTEGPIYDAMKQWHDPKHPGRAATVLRVEEVFSGSEWLA